MAQKQTQHKRDNREHTYQERSTVRTQTAKSHVGRNGEKKRGGGEQKEENGAIGAREPSGSNPKWFATQGRTSKLGHAIKCGNTERHAQDTNKSSHRVGANEPCG